MSDLMFLFYMCTSLSVGCVSGYFYRELKGELLQASTSIFSERDRIAKKIGDKMLKNIGR